MSDKTVKNCPNSGVPYLEAINHQAGEKIVIKALCKQWNCEYCGQVNLTTHRARILRGFYELSEQGYKWSWLTLTCHEKTRGLERSVAVWRSAWTRLSQRMRDEGKRQGKDIHFVYVPEKHSDGTIHIHGMFPLFLSERWWKDNARACGLGYQVKMVELKTAGLAVWYCTKYMSKHLDDFGEWVKGFRKINYSRSFPAFEKGTSKLEWSVIPPDVALQDAIRNGWQQGLDVRFLGELMQFPFDGNLTPYKI